LTITAGRISAAGFIPQQPVVSSTRDTASSSTIALGPDAVLFRSKNAPPRYTESDVYFANERRSVVDLPESDLLKSLHCYISDFYARATLDGGIDDWKSLDETALIALGVLLEEVLLEVLGKTGDLVFTDGEEIPNSTVQLPPVQESTSKRRPSKKRRIDVAEG